MKTNKIFYWIGILFPLPEVLVLLMFPLIFFVFNQEITIFMRDIVSIKISSDILSKIAYVPLAIIPVSAYFVIGILSPDHEDKKILHNWQDLWALRRTCMSGLVYQALFAAISLISLAACSSQNVESMELAIIIAAVGTAYSSLTFLNAKVRVQEFLSRDKTEKL